MKRLLATLFVVATLLAAIGIVLVLMGYRPFVIDSESMEPLYKKGSLCWIDTTAELDSLAKGDVIAYRSPADSLVLHRIVGGRSSSEDEIMVEMQGDANNTVQEMTLSRINFIGREAFTIPGLGNLVAVLSQETALVLVVLLIALACVPRLPRLRHLHTRLDLYLHRTSYPSRRRDAPPAFLH